MAEAKRRRLLRLAAVLCLLLAPRGVGDVGIERAALPAHAPRPGLIHLSAATLFESPTPLELGPPDLLALALRTQGVGNFDLPPPAAAQQAPEAPDPVDTAGLDAGLAAAQPIPEPPAALLIVLGIATLPLRLGVPAFRLARAPDGPARAGSRRPGSRVVTLSGRSAADASRGRRRSPR